MYNFSSFSRPSPGFGRHWQRQQAGGCGAKLWAAAAGSLLPSCCPGFRELCNVNPLGLDLELLWLAWFPSLNFLVSAYLAEIIYLHSWSISSRPDFLGRPLIWHKYSSTFLRLNSFLNFLFLSFLLCIFSSRAQHFRYDLVFTNIYYIQTLNVWDIHILPLIYQVIWLYLMTVLIPYLTTSCEQLKRFRAFSHQLLS